jgi:hypothetical protein
MRLTMKTYTDAGQLPLREVMDTLPSFGADSRNLGPTGQTVSRPVTETREFKTENIVANKGGSHDLTLAVATCHSEQQSGVEGVRIPSLRHILQGNRDGDSQRDSQTSVPLSPELSHVVTAWEKLPAPLKAAILAIINSAEGQP